jgi:hypothetical protein
LIYGYEGGRLTGLLTASSKPKPIIPKKRKDGKGKSYFLLDFFGEKMKEQRKEYT